MSSRRKGLLTEATVAIGEIFEGGVEGGGEKVGEVFRGEVKFAVSTLPRHKTRETEFFAGADDKVGVGEVGGVEFGGD